MMENNEEGKGAYAGAMNKSELVSAVESAGKAGDFASHAGAERAVNNLFHVIRKEVRRGNKVVVSGFGTFVLSKHKKRRGMHPQNGTPIEIPERTVVRFKPSPCFLEEFEEEREEK